MMILCKVTFPKIIAQKSPQGPGVGVTKAPFVNFSVTGNFDLANV